jgi:hypothetical protein
MNYNLLTTVQQTNIRSVLAAVVCSSSGGGGGGGTWGSITGTLSNQTDLQTALNAKQNTITNGNGTTVNGSAVNLGGPLTNIVQIDTLGTYDIDIGDISTGLYFEATSGFIHMVGPYSIFSMGDSDDGGGGLLYTDTRTTKQGIKYFAAGYVTDDRSLTDRGFVESGTVTFTNKSGNISQWTNDSGYITSLSGSWLLASGGTLSAANTLVGSASNTLTFKFDGLNTTQTNGAGHWLTNTTAAAAGAQQISPSTVWEGQGWKTTATAASQSVKYSTYVLPIQGTANPTANLVFNQSINGAAYTRMASMGAVNSSARNTFTVGSGTLGISEESGVGIRIGGMSGGGGYAVKFVDNNDSLFYANFINGGYAFGLSAVTTNSTFYVAQAALSSSWKPLYRSDPGAHTALTAATEFVSRDFQGASQTWIDGTVATQRFNYFKGYTVNKTTTSATFTDIFNVYIESTTAGSSVTLTNNWALGVAGNLKVTGTRVNMASLPTSSAGLATGDIWSNSGVLTKV